MSGNYSILNRRYHRPLQRQHGNIVVLAEGCGAGGCGEGEGEGDVPRMTAQEIDAKLAAKVAAMTREEVIVPSEELLAKDVKTDDEDIELLKIILGPTIRFSR